MSTRPNAAFLMLRKTVGKVDAGTGLRVSAADIVPAAELVEAEYATAARTITGSSFAHAGRRRIHQDDRRPDRVLMAEQRMSVMRSVRLQANRQGIQSDTMPANALFTGISAAAGETVSQRDILCPRLSPCASQLDIQRVRYQCFAKALGDQLCPAPHWSEPMSMRMVL